MTHEYHGRARRRFVQSSRIKHPEDDPLLFFLARIALLLETVCAHDTLSLVGWSAERDFLEHFVPTAEWAAKRVGHPSLDTVQIGGGASNQQACAGEDCHYSTDHARHSRGGRAQGSWPCRGASGANWVSE